MAKNMSFDNLIILLLLILIVVVIIKFVLDKNQENFAKAPVKKKVVPTKKLTAADIPKMAMGSSVMGSIKKVVKKK
jgi:hypothetical protein